ncbi:MAG: rod-binding protein [Verrucomicrobiota bacterium]|jgi:flagellar protein FlgJ
MEISSLQRASLNAADIPLERLANNASLSESDKIKEVSRQFEAVLLKQILSQSQKSGVSGGALSSGSNSSNSIYQDMITEQMADRISRGGSFGFAQVIEKQLSHQFIHKNSDNTSSTALQQDGANL